MANESIKSFWGKKASNGELKWLPLVVHLADTAEVGKLLWDAWLCDGAKQNIANHCTFSGTPDDAEKLRQARALFVFLCAAHDLGKATPAFQTKGARPSYAGLNDQRERDERNGKCRDLDEVILSKLKGAGFLCPAVPEGFKTPHALCSQVILLREAGQNARNVAAILGAHHGKPQNKDTKASQCESYLLNYYGGKEGKTVWEAAQKSLYLWAMSEAGFGDFSEVPFPNLVASAELSGLLVMADWISSNDWLFPYIFIDDDVDIARSAIRAKRGFNLVALTHPWEPLSDLSDGLDAYYLRRFSFSEANVLQRRMLDIAQQTTGIVVVEAPMGYGKTETALAAAEVLAQKTGRTGVFFALPTQATSNGIFHRLVAWISSFDDSRCHSVELFHSRAEYNDDWKKLKDDGERQRYEMAKNGDENGADETEDDTLIVNDWFSGRKKTMLADFVVGTIDQLLMGAFKHKHLMLRHLGLANKVVIIDECHAYDAYMSVYLERVLEWLGKYEIPAIVLSATLPSEKRRAVVDAYCGIKRISHEANKHDCELFGLTMPEQTSDPEWMTTRAYPLITYSDGQNKEDIHFEIIPRDNTRRAVMIHRIADEALSDNLAKALENGGCAGVIVNSVSRAQTLYKALSSRFGCDKVLLFHSRFLIPDRSEIERQVLRMLGKPGANTQRPEFQIVIGTQVLEQSLDIDFDVLYTDIAPMDLLIQRIGRLHRHTRIRPKNVSSPVCYVMGIQENDTFQRSSVAVYGNYLLMRTLARLPETIVLPDDISQLVEDVYNENCRIYGMDEERYENAKMQYCHVIREKENRAAAFRLGNANTSRRSSLNGWLDGDGGDVQERAAVRDIEESVEVILVQAQDDGYIHLFDKEHSAVSRNETPSDDMAREILRYSLELPIGIIHQFDDIISNLEKCCEEVAIWQKSRWLKGCLILIFDNNGQFKGLPGFVLSYSQTEGLSYIKEQANA